MRWIQKISEFVRSQPDVFRFLVFGFGGYIVWHLTYEEYLKPATLLDEYDPTPDHQHGMGHGIAGLLGQCLLPGH